MTIALYYTPFEIYEKYKRMTKRNNFTHDQSIRILADLNAVTKKNIESIITQESAKEQELGIIGYTDANRGNYSQTHSTDKYHYKIEN